MIRILLFCALIALPATAADDQETEILQVLADAEAGWNDGDLEAYMQGYWKSPELRFASGGDVTKGWQATLGRYRARYADRAIMGTLVFSDLDVEMLADDAAVVFGRWELRRDADTPSGLFTLLFRRLDVGWRIVHDHTSSASD